MYLFERRDLKPRRLAWRDRAHRLLQILAFGAVALATAGFSVSVIVAATDPDWVGTPPTNISNSGTRKTLHPAIAAGPPGQVLVAWNDLAPGETKSDIYVTRSDDHGKSWRASPTRVWDTTAKSQLPDIAIAGDKTLIAWTEQTGTGNDATFTVYEAELASGDTRPVPIPEGPSRITTGPRLAANAKGSDTLHIVFNAGQIFSHIFYSSRLLTDAIWPTATQIYTSTNSMSWSPALDVGPDGAELHVVWEEKPFGSDRNVWYMHGSIGSPDVSWSPPLKLSGETTSVKPDLAVSSDGNVHIVWGEADSEQISAAYYVRYCHFDPDKETCFESKRVDARPVYVNEISPTESSPRLALWEDNDQIHLCVTWHGFREGESAEDIFVSCSEDGGETWQSASIMSPLPEGVTESADISIWPSIVFDASGTLHGVWQQRVDIVSAESYYEIYYAHAMNRVFLPLITRNG